MSVLGTGPGSLDRAGIDLHYWSISPAPPQLKKNIYDLTVFYIQGILIISILNSLSHDPYMCPSYLQIIFCFWFSFFFNHWVKLVLPTSKCKPYLLKSMPPTLRIKLLTLEVEFQPLVKVCGFKAAQHHGTSGRIQVFVWTAAAVCVCSCALLKTTADKPDWYIWGDEDIYLYFFTFV